MQRAAHPTICVRRQGVNAPVTPIGGRRLPAGVTGRGFRRGRGAGGAYTPSTTVPPPRPPAAARPVLTGRALSERLAEAFGVPRPDPPPPGDPPPDPLERVVRTLISQHTSGPNSRRAYASLRRCFPSWEEMRDAPPEAIAGAIRSAGLAGQKAPRIKALLARVEAERGALDLRFLYDLSDAAAMTWLRRLPGIGQTTAACALLFGMRRPVMPVDGGILRVARRLGIVPPNGSPDSVQHALQAGLAGEQVYPLHVNLIRLARELCTPREPACAICPLNDGCGYFQTGGAR